MIRNIRGTIFAERVGNSYDRPGQLPTFANSRWRGQLAAILRAKIAKAEWRNGPLPSVKQLQQEHDVGRDTVLRAVGILRDEGLVFTVPRRGTYVSPDNR